MPTISIVIPSYNQAQYLAEAIESAYNQTMAPLEIIVVDDGSTDNSLEIANSYTFAKYPLIESPVRVISQVNKGLPSARNTGIMNAKGDYILFLDADDMFLENAVEKITHRILQTGCDIVAPSFKCFGTTNNEVILGNPTLADFQTANRLGYFCAVRRSALLEIGGYSPRMIYGYEDYHLWINLLARGKTVHAMQDILVLYRTKENSMLHEAQKHHDELMAQINNDFKHLYA